MNVWDALEVSGSPEARCHLSEISEWVRVAQLKLEPCSNAVYMDVIFLVYIQPNRQQPQH